MSGGDPLPVDRLHNLENLLDMYEYAENDVLVNEAIANAVDAFKDHSVTTRKINISFIKKDNNVGYLLFHNNAPPMTEKQFYGKDGYHKVSFSSKQKGHGIGFAGVGAKLFLASKQGGEIITVTGKGKNNFMASKMYRINHDVEFKTTEKHPLKEILNIPKYSHSFGTTYGVRLSLHAYRELKERISGIIQFWWNYALITKQITITIDEKVLSPWLPKGDKFKKIFNWKKQKIPALCFISKESIPEMYRHIVYTVFGKRIHHDPLDLAIRIKSDYANRVFCIVDLSILANQLTSNKENFKKNNSTSDCKTIVEDGFWEFLEDQKLLNVEFQQDIQVVTNELTKKIDQLLDTKDFKDLNPFLNTRKRNTLTLNNDTGDVVGATYDDDSRIESDSNDSSDDNDSNDSSDDSDSNDSSDDSDSNDSSDDNDKNSGNADSDDGSSLIEDNDADKIASRKEKKSKGLKLVFTKKLQIHNEEARVETKAGAIVIDELHPMYLRTKNIKKLQNYNLMRIVIESLIRHKNDEVEWDAKETMYRFRNFLHAVWGIE